MHMMTSHYEVDPNNRSRFYYYSQLVFSVKFIIFVFLFVLLLFALFFTWGQAKSGDQLERLARERNAGIRGLSDRVQTARKTKKLRTLSPDLYLAISQCPHPRKSSSSLLASIRKLDADSACKKAIFSAACQLEKGILYQDTLPVTCERGTKFNDNSFLTPRILFVINVNSAGARQIERLLTHVYQKEHYYLLLIPNCFSELLHRLDLLRHVVLNLRLLSYTIECPNDATADPILEETPATWSFILKNATDWNWNYMLSLDSYDFPILNVAKFTNYLGNHPGTNFLESYSIDESSDYVRNISVSVCQDGGRRWPIGERAPPKGPQYFQGPPWYLLTKKFLEYALFSDEKLAVGLRTFSTLTPFPAQLLFHTLAHNGRYCETFVNESLRLTKYHIFDQRTRESGVDRLTSQEQDQLTSWTFMPKDFVYFSHWRNEKLGMKNKSGFTVKKFFARRFDPTINQQIVSDLESTLYDYPLYSMDSPGMHSYWQTLWNKEMKDQRTSTVRYQAVGSLLGDLCMKRLRRCRIDQSTNSVIHELSLYRQFDMNDGLILSFNVTCSNITIPLQCYVNFVQQEKVKSVIKDVADLRNDILHIRVGSDYDPMENIFRNYAGSVILGKNERFGIRTQWVPGEMSSMYQIAWLDPEEYVSATSYADIGAWTTYHFDPRPQDLAPSLEYGVWTAAMLNEGKVIGASEFLVLPETALAHQNIAMKDRLRWARRFYEINRLCVPKTFSKTFRTKCACAPPPVPTCEDTMWSTLGPDIKSDFLSFLRSRKD